MAYTIPFIRKQYHRFFSTQSEVYQAAFPIPENDSVALYILDGKILHRNGFWQLGRIDTNNLKKIELIDQKAVKKLYRVSNKTIGVVITTSYNPEKKK